MGKFRSGCTYRADVKKRGGEKRHWGVGEEQHGERKSYGGGGETHVGQNGKNEHVGDEGASWLR